MKILAVKSIPLSRETIDGWKSTDNLTIEGLDDVSFRFMKRNRHENESVGLAIRNKYDMILNLGNSHLTSDSPLIWNNEEVARVLRTPGDMRKSALSACLPPPPVPGSPFWVKGPGRGGINKTRYEEGTPMRVFEDGWDVQKDVEGDEWRIVTVGLRLVQSNRRHGPNGDRTYEWVGTADTPLAVKSIVRYAASLLPNMRTVIAWDVISNPEGVYILEGNTSPGVNGETACRIVRELYRQVIDGDVRDELTPRTTKWLTNNADLYRTAITTQYFNTANVNINDTPLTLETIEDAFNAIMDGGARMREIRRI